MSKQKKAPAPVEPAADVALVALESASTTGVVDAVTVAGEEPGLESAEAAAGNAENEQGDESDTGEEESADGDATLQGGELQPLSADTVPALVLSDNHLGKVGQVIQVNAAQAEALRLGGLIDTHPNAVASVAPEA